ncbi:MAG TPA: hypothetical protein VL947_02090, partial [Cytophagales bacterium]|nr:hypothetical protein [Cytophagales bacterium]
MLFNRHKSKLKCFLSWIYIIYASISHLHAEGTKEIKPQTGNHGDLRLVSAVSPGAKFASYNGPEYE